MATTEKIIIPVEVKGDKEAKTKLKGIGKAGGAAGKAIGVGLKAAGIGLLILALTTVIDLFKSWQPLIDFVNVQMAKMGAIFSTIGQAFGNFFTEGFSAFDNLGEKINTNIDAAVELEKRTIALVEAQILLTAESAKLRLERAKLRLISNDESAALVDRIAAQKEAIAITQELAVLEVKQATERAAILRGSQAIGATRRAERLELAQLEAAISDQEIKRINEERTLLLKLGVLQKQLQTENITRQTEINRLLKEQNDLIEKQIPLTQRGANITNETQGIQIEGIKTIASVEATAGDARRLGFEETAKFAQFALNELFEGSKAAAIANVFMSAREGVQKAFTLLPPFSFAYAGVIIAAAAANIAAITGVTLGGGGSASGGVPRGGGVRGGTISGGPRTDIQTSLPQTLSREAQQTAVREVPVVVIQDINREQQSLRTTQELSTL